MEEILHIKWLQEINGKEGKQVREEELLYTWQIWDMSGTSLAVQWLRLHAPSAGSPGSIPGQGTRSHKPQLRPGAAK